MSDGKDHSTKGATAMTVIDQNQLAIVARQVHTNLRAIQAQAEAEHPDIRTVAQIVSSTATIINDWTPISIRRRWSPGDMTTDDVWHAIMLHMPTLAKFITTYQVDPSQAELMVPQTRNRLLALGIILYGVLGCDNIRRALHGDISRPVIAIDGPALDYNPTGQMKEMLMVVKVHFQMERMTNDLRTIMANLRGISDEIAGTKAFNLIEVALLIGPVLDLVQQHITLPLRKGPPGTMTSREWIKQATTHCLENANRLYAAWLRCPTDESEMQKLQVQATHVLVQLFITYRDIYLAPDMQNALALCESDTEA